MQAIHISLSLRAFTPHLKSKNSLFHPITLRIMVSNTNVPGENAEFQLQGKEETW